MISESVAEFKGKLRLYYERLSLFMGRKKKKINNEEKQYKSSLVLYIPKTEQMLAHFGVKPALSIYRTIHISQITGN